MTREEAIAIIENEKECVNRANKNDYCNRDCYNCELVKTDTEILTALDMAIKALEQQPCEDATLKDIFCMGCEYKEQELKTGHWIMTGDYLITACGNVDYVKCSCCREYSLEEGDYCPNCGVKMEAEE